MRTAACRPLTLDVPQHFCMAAEVVGDQLGVGGGRREIRGTDCCRRYFPHAVVMLYPCQEPGPLSADADTKAAAALHSQLQGSQKPRESGGSSHHNITNQNNPLRYRPSCFHHEFEVVLPVNSTREEQGINRRHEH